MAHLTLVPGQDRTDHDEPPHEPTDDTRAMVIAGLLNEMPMESIAGVLGISC
ncbi:hypothetical protein [Microvirga ossetica]|uniref:hypothetical protein n=1 Tax=Microvirga ossetica TaxID=1882682 RepID=UPI0013000C94|nr:hypothetical protein [Microvirga ossetica]